MGGTWSYILLSSVESVWCSFKFTLSPYIGPCLIVQSNVQFLQVAQQYHGNCSTISQCVVRISDLIWYI